MQYQAIVVGKIFRSLIINAFTFLQSPRVMPLKATHILKPEAKPHVFHDSDGTVRTLPVTVFVDPLTNKETVDCNILGTDEILKSLPKGCGTSL